MIQRYGQEYDDSDPMLGDYADLAQKGLSIFKRFGSGAKALIKKVAARARARKAKKHGGAPSAPIRSNVSTPFTPQQFSDHASQNMVIDHPEHGLPKWALPVGIAAAAYLFLTRRGE
jgi:hypothetical protein